jgi:hypothetical protein
MIRDPQCFPLLQAGSVLRQMRKETVLFVCPE